MWETHVNSHRHKLAYFFVQCQKKRFISRPCILGGYGTSKRNTLRRCEALALQLDPTECIE